MSTATSTIEELANREYKHGFVTDIEADALPRGLSEEMVLVDERPIGVRAQKVRGQDLIEPLHIAMLHRMDVVAIERGQRIKVASRG